MSQTQFMWVTSLSLALNELTRFIQIHDAILELEAGMQSLMYGQLTPALIGIRGVERDTGECFTSSRGQRNETLRYYCERCLRGKNLRLRETRRIVCI
jgi:hypothetical protein